MSTNNTNQGPRRITQIVHLRPEHLDAYKACHAAVWPEVLDQIRDCSIVDYSITLIEIANKPTLVANFKYVGESFDADMARMAANPKVQEWWRMTDGMQESANPGAKGSFEGSREGGVEWWRGGEEVFWFEK